MIRKSLASSFQLIKNDKLFISEPNPMYFGNNDNEPDNPNWTNKNWLKSRFHFHFAEYRHGGNDRYGVLRVLNDDLVQPERGFGKHGHSNMEICTYIIDGELTHQDSMSNKETLSRGSIQFMSAGTGVSHSEYNLNKKKPLRFIQMWILPREMNGSVHYGSYSGENQLKNRLNKWQHLVSDVKNHVIKTPVKINQDVNIYVSELDLNKELQFDILKNRQVYLLCMEGEIQVKSNDKNQQSYQLIQHDAAKVTSQHLHFLSTSTKSHILIIEMASENIINI